MYFFYQTFQKRENPHADKGFLVPSREDIFLQRYFFPLCWMLYFPISLISLLNLQEIYWKIPGWPQERRAEWP